MRTNLSSQIFAVIPEETSIDLLVLGLGRVGEVGGKDTVEGEVSDAFVQYRL